MKTKKDVVNILMVDDQPAKLLTYEAILSGLGENLVRANSGKEALDHLLHTDFAVVLMDVSMPDIDGFELASMIRQHPRFQKTPIILISAIHLTDLDRLKGYEAGAVDYIPVPVIPEILRAKVSVFADLYRKTEQLLRLNLELEQRVAERTADLEATAERLREADQRKDQFLATLAHELRNPLAPISNAAKVLRLKALEDNDLKWAQKVIERQVVHLARLVDDLLDVSRISRNKLELRPERVDVNAVINAAVEVNRPLIDQMRHELVLKLSREPVYLNADMVRLSQVFGNLLNNGAKFTKPGGRIEITVEVDGSSAVITVKDDGIGIPPDQLSRLPELFFQLDTSLEKSYGGLGVGLTLVWQLVAMHGGSVEVRSEGPGRGSEFVVKLPVLEESIREPRQEDPVQTESQKGALRILVADDNQDSADGLALWLELEGYEVKAVYDGQTAFESIEELRPDVALLDIGMPVLNGYDLARKIRQQPWGKNIALVAQTGWGQKEDIRNAKEAGFDFHVTKPIDYDLLQDMLQRYSSTEERPRLSGEG